MPLKRSRGCGVPSQNCQGRFTPSSDTDSELNPKSRRLIGYPPPHSPADDQTAARACKPHSRASGEFHQPITQPRIPCRRPPTDPPSGNDGGSTVHFQGRKAQLLRAWLQQRPTFLANRRKPHGQVFVSRRIFHAPHHTLPSVLPVVALRWPRSRPLFPNRSRAPLTTQTPLPDRCSTASKTNSPRPPE